MLGAPALHRPLSSAPWRECWVLGPRAAGSQLCSWPACGLAPSPVLPSKAHLLLFSTFSWLILLVFVAG